MPTEEQITELINTLRSRTHVNIFADMCAERAQGYAETASHADAHATARYARYAARYATSSCAGERELQLTHLKELHAREENLKKD